MSRRNSIFGWDLPPGVTQAMIEERTHGKHNHYPEICEDCPDSEGDGCKHKLAPGYCPDVIAWEKEKRGKT